jgi:hypothetical protein
MAAPAFVTGGALALAAAGEMLLDKLPLMPARIGPLPLLARAVSGAWSASRAPRGGSRVAGAAWIGAASAVGSAVILYGARRLAHRARVPNWLAGLAEDGMVLGTGLLLRRRLTSSR